MASARSFLHIATLAALVAACMAASHHSFSPLGRKSIRSVNAQAAMDSNNFVFPQGPIQWTWAKSGLFTDVQKQLVKDALSEYNKTCIQLVYMDKPTMPYWIEYSSISPSKECQASNLGYTAGQGAHPVYLPPHCLDWTTVIHETGHMLGQMHEFQRFDRPLFAQSQKVENSWAYTTSRLDGWFPTNHDLSSVLYYDTNSWITAGAKVATWSFSQSDIFGMNWMYTRCQAPGRAAVPICGANLPSGNNRVAPGRTISVDFYPNLAGGSSVIITHSLVNGVKSSVPTGTILRTPSRVTVMFTPTAEMIGGYVTVLMKVSNAANTANTATCSQTFLVVRDSPMDDCFGKFVSDGEACSGHGRCATKDVCLCSTGWFGPDCSFSNADNVPTLLYSSAAGTSQGATAAATFDGTQSYDFNFPAPMQVRQYSVKIIQFNILGKYNNTDPWTMDVQDGNGVRIGQENAVSRLGAFVHWKVAASRFEYDGSRDMPAKGRIRLFGSNIGWQRYTGSVYPPSPSASNNNYGLSLFGTVWCHDGFYGSQCQKQCPGVQGSAFDASTVAFIGAVQCAGNGLCNDGPRGDGSCTCFGNYDPTTGCKLCVTGFGGPDCTVPQPAYLNIDAPALLMTGEDGSTATFTVKLPKVPTANVMVTCTSSDTTKATISTAPLEFTASNWSTPAVVTVAGKDNDVLDGGSIFAITCVSTSPAWEWSLLVGQVAGLNHDNETASGCNADYKARCASPPNTQCYEAQGACDILTGQCIYLARTGTTCNDKNDFTINDMCVNGVCTGTACNLDICFVPGLCKAPGRYNCTTGVCAAQDFPDGTPCDDGTRECQKGKCVAVANKCATQCDDTALSVCQVAGICKNGACPAPITMPDGTACDDSDDDTIYDTCTKGVCSGYELCDDVECGPLGPCVASWGDCVPTSGTCTPIYKEDGAACNDGILETTNDKCTAGVCAGTAVKGGTVILPAGWDTMKCAAYRYGDSLCDCGCGAPDIDCSGCTTASACADSGCLVVDASRILNPAGWCDGGATVRSCDLCASKPCGDFGTCTLVGGGKAARCNCNQGYTGEFCTRAVCDDVICENSGTCVSVRGQPTCVCKAGTSGEFCEIATGTVPANWTCSSRAYFDTRCDCGCGVPDPACAQCQSSCPAGCAVYSPTAAAVPNAYCDASLKPQACGKPTVPAVPAEWNCFTSSWGDGVCDCGCGAVDVDCTSCSADKCCVVREPSNYGGSKTRPNSYCANNAIVACKSDVCARATCSANTQCVVANNAAGFTCQCKNSNSVGDSCVDPCANNPCSGGICIPQVLHPECAVGTLDKCYTCQCLGGSAGDKCQYQLASLPAAPSGWTCGWTAYYDSICDCGCGVVDPACKACSCATGFAPCAITSTATGLMNDYATCANNTVQLCRQGIFTLTNNTQVRQGYNVSIYRSPAENGTICISDANTVPVCPDTPNGLCKVGDTSDSSGNPIEFPIINASRTFLTRVCTRQQRNKAIWSKWQIARTLVAGDAAATASVDAVYRNIPFGDILVPGPVTLSVFSLMPQINLVFRGTRDTLPTAADITNAIVGALPDITAADVIVTQEPNVTTTAKLDTQAVTWGAQAVVRNAGTAAQTACVGLKNAFGTPGTLANALGAQALTGCAQSTAGGAGEPAVGVLELYTADGVLIPTPKQSDIDRPQQVKLGYTSANALVICATAYPPNSGLKEDNTGLCTLDGLACQPNDNTKTFSLTTTGSKGEFYLYDIQVYGVWKFVLQGCSTAGNSQAINQPVTIGNAKYSPLKWQRTKDSKLSKGAVAGIIIGVIACVVISLIVGVVAFMGSKKRMAAEMEASKAAAYNSPNNVHMNHGFAIPGASGAGPTPSPEPQY